MKPLGRKNYGSIGHLPCSRMGPADHACHPGQQRICTEKARDKHDTIIVTEKLDGCLAWNTRVRTDAGLIKLGVIVNQRLRVNALSYNAALGTCEYKPITAYHRKDAKPQWLRVHVRSRLHGASKRTVICTPNHKLFTQRGWVRADQLDQQDRLHLLGSRLGDETRQVILGKLLGDGSICQPHDYHTPTLQWSHGVAQSDYFDFVKQMLGPLAREHKPFRGGYAGSDYVRRGRLASSAVAGELIASLCMDAAGKKTISQGWADAIDPLGLAFWYMDDGSIRADESDQRPRAQFATNGFPMAGVAILSQMLATRFGMANKIFDRKGPTITLTADATERLFAVIYPYVPPSMRYKVPAAYRDRPFLFAALQMEPRVDGLLSTDILDIERDPKVWEQPNCQYDITVADNHNFFAGDVLVHNSNVGIARVGDTIHALGRAGHLAQTSKYEQHQLFAAWVREREQMFREMLPDGHRLVGEWLAQAHGTRYSLPHGPFVAFDLMRAASREPYEVLAAGCALYAIPMPKLIHVGGPISVEKAMALHGGGDHGCDEPEGIVYRVERRGAFDFMAKWVRPDKVDGKYLPEVAGAVATEPVWNWRPTK